MTSAAPPSNSWPDDGARGPREGRVSRATPSRRRGGDTGVAAVNCAAGWMEQRMGSSWWSLHHGDYTSFAMILVLR